jgi:hypothetical protein
VTAAELPDPDVVGRRIVSDWGGTVPRAVLEAYFGRGVLAIANRESNFARCYDLAERVLPEEHLARAVPREIAQRELLLQAAKASGIAAAPELADYFRMSRSEARPRIAELVASGELQQVRVEGWREPAYLHRSAYANSTIDACALLSPFDPLIWHRPRAARLFEFDHRFEIFVPQEKRRWGTYVLPFLYGERLVARVDLKADRPNRSLQVLAAYIESHADEQEVATALATELRTLATWLKFESIVLEQRGNFFSALQLALDD